jgi:molecular chaperone DnaK
LEQSEVDGMVRDAAEHAEEDRKARESADVRNRADQLIYQVEKTLKENESKFSTEDRTSVGQSLQEAREALEKGDVEQIKGASDRLEKAAHKLAEAMYRTESGPGSPADGPGSATGGPQGTDDVIDAEVVEDGKPN